MMNITSVVHFLALELLFFSGSPVILYHGKSASNMTLIEQLQQISRPLPAFCFFNISDPTDLERLADDASILNHSVIIELDFEPERKISEESYEMMKKLRNRMSMLTVVHFWHKECNMTELLIQNRLAEIGDLCKSRVQKFDPTIELPGLNIKGIDTDEAESDEGDSKMRHLLYYTYPKECEMMCSSTDLQNNLAICADCQLCRAERLQDYLDWMQEEERRRYSEEICEFREESSVFKRKMEELMQEYGPHVTLLITLLVIICPVRDAARDIALAFCVQWVSSLHRPASCVALTIQVHLLIAVAVLRDHREPLRHKILLDIAKLSNILYGIATVSIIISRLAAVVEIEYTPYEVCNRFQDRYYYSIQIMLAVAISLVLYSLEYLEYRNAASFWKKLSISLFILNIQIILLRITSNWLDPVIIMIVIPLISKLILGFYLPFVTLYSSHSDAQVQVGLLPNENFDLSYVDHQETQSSID